jgi:hypothetical protein
MDDFTFASVERKGETNTCGVRHNLGKTGADDIVDVHHDFGDFVRRKVKE